MFSLPHWWGVAHLGRFEWLWDLPTGLTPPAALYWLAFSPGELMILFDGVEICLLGERSFRLSFHEQVLAEVRHLFLSILFVELNDLFQ